MSKDNGGPAFPCAGVLYPDGTVWDAGSNGMTLRDYFAAKAFQVRLSQAEARGWTLTEVCQQSWADADAILAARAK